MDKSALKTVLAFACLLAVVGASSNKKYAARYHDAPIKDDEGKGPCKCRELQSIAAYAAESAARASEISAKAQSRAAYALRELADVEKVVATSVPDDISAALDGTLDSEDDVKDAVKIAEDLADIAAEKVTEALKESRAALKECKKEGNKGQGPIDLPGPSSPDVFVPTVALPPTVDFTPA